MISGQVVSHEQIGLSVRTREEAGMPHNIVLAGANSVHGTGRTMHKFRSERFIEAADALIQAAGVLAVVQDTELIMELTGAPAYGPVREIIPAFAEKLGKCIIPQLPLEQDPAPPS
jgi:hypothetical protein